MEGALCCTMGIFPRKHRGLYLCLNIVLEPFPSWGALGGLAAAQNVLREVVQLASVFNILSREPCL